MVQHQSIFQRTSTPYQLIHRSTIEHLNAYFVDNQDISDLNVILEIVRKLDIDDQAFCEAVQHDTIKEAYKASVEEIVNAKSIFGAPYFVVDGEPFWGADRVVQIDEWLTTGGW